MKPIIIIRPSPYPMKLAIATMHNQTKCWIIFPNESN